MEPPAMPRPRPTCLVVDDSPTMRKIARRLLGELGFVCTEAADGAAALGMVEADPPSLVLLDWNMPVLDGLATLQALRATPKGRTPRIVMCTTNTDIDQIAAALDAGADEYIMKPYNADILASKLLDVGLIQP
jgi:two-component system chemotaxis response regulator CheY